MNNEEFMRKDDTTSIVNNNLPGNSKKNKNIISIILLVVAVILIGLGIYFGFIKKDGNSGGSGGTSTDNSKYQAVDYDEYRKRNIQPMLDVFYKRSIYCILFTCVNL